MELLERESELLRLTQALDTAANGAGSVVFVRGEAGIGKTSLLREFVGSTPERCFVLWGGRDDLLTPIPLSPIWEMATEAPSLADAARESEPAALYLELMNLLSRRLRPTIVVIEDAHWADEATLDVIRYVGRRVGPTNGLILVTYRTVPGDVGSHLDATVADMPGDWSLRMDLAPLSREAVETIASRLGRSGGVVYEESGGNPFLVTEMLAGPDDSIPPTVRDSMVARVSGLSPGARSIVELVSIIPGRAERSLLDKVAGPILPDLGEAERAGILVVTDQFVAFRHEVARRAMESTLLGTRRQHLNERVYEALIASEAAPARLVHHARAAGDREGLVFHAIKAAEVASSHASHQEAVENYRLLGGLLDVLETEEQARALERWAWEEWTVGMAGAAEERGLQASDLWESLGDSAGVSRALRVVTQARWGLAEMDRAEESAARALDVLEPGMHPNEEAAAYAIQSWLAMIRVDVGRAIERADRAIALAEAIDDLATKAHALDNKGVALGFSDYPAGVEFLEQSIALSRRNGFDQEAIRAAANLGDVHREHRQLADYERWLSGAESLSEASGSERFRLHLRGRRADLDLLRGHWASAMDHAHAALASPLYVAPDRPTPLTVLGLLSARQERGTGLDALEEAAQISSRLDNLERFGPAAAALAEAHYLTGDFESVRPLVLDALDQARDRRFPWMSGELAYWLWKADELEGIPEPCAEPYRLHITGEWAEAARLWQGLGLPYQQALALMEGGTEDQIRCLSLLDGLGARVLSSKVRQDLRARGVRNLPRPERAGRAGLTDRQLEVLTLIAKGLTNSQIAIQAFISPKTVERHVSAILAQLGVKNRREAIEVGRERSLIPGP